MQGTPEWRHARLGRLTGSVAKTLFLSRKDKTEPAGIRDLRMQLALERITQEVEPELYKGEDVKRGIALQPAAKAAYERATGEWVDEVGFLQDTEILAGVSPDGYVGRLGEPGLVIVEFKCRRNAHHAEALTERAVPKEFGAQILHTFWQVPECTRIDYVSYAPHFPEASRLAIVPVARETLTVEIDGYVVLAKAFLRSLGELIDKIVGDK